MNQIQAKADASSAGKRAKPITDNMPEKVTAHSVRGFRGCLHCGGLGHKDHMILGESGHDADKFFHTLCYVQRYGFDAVLTLSIRNRGMFRLCDLSKAQMRKLMESFR